MSWGEKYIKNYRTSSQHNKQQAACQREFRRDEQKYYGYKQQVDQILVSVRPVFQKKQDKCHGCQRTNNSKIQAGSLKNSLCIQFSAPRLF